MLLNQVGYIRAVIVLDKEGHAIISKYYNAPELSVAEKREFEKDLYKKSKKFSDSSAYHSQPLSLTQRQLLLHQQLNGFREGVR